MQTFRELYAREPEPESQVKQSNHVKPIVTSKFFSSSWFLLGCPSASWHLLAKKNQAESQRPLRLDPQSRGKCHKPRLPQHRRSFTSEERQ